VTAAASQRGLAGVPYGVFSAGGAPPAVGARVGDAAIDLGALARAGLYDEHVDDAIELFCAPSLNRLLARGRAVWSAARARTLELIAAPPQRAIVPLSEATMLLPIEVADYVDFYASIEHATNLGKLFRPDGDPLLPNYRWIPIGYHGRAGTVVVSGTPIVRPRGQRKPPDVAEPSFGPSQMLDFELEVGFITGDGPPLGTPIPAGRARDHVFGIVLLNDWSARDIQAWEYQPLGPFLGKSFATSISAWVVPLDALEPFRVAGPEQQPPPLDYLRTTGAQNYDIDLEASLASAAMTATGVDATVISRTNFRAMYWSMAQQLAHMSSNGSRVRAGDLYGSGTISGAEAGTYGSAIELTSRGTKPLALGDGTRRGFLEDGDTVTLRGWCGDGDERVDLGDVSGTIAPAIEP
jgi:fumarylacetoacetase